MKNQKNKNQIIYFCIVFLYIFCCSSNNSGNSPQSKLETNKTRIFSQDSINNSKQPVIIKRADWDTEEYIKGGKNHIQKYITIHHTGTKYYGNPNPQKLLVNIKNFHQITKSWYDIAYHYFIDLEGLIYEGRDINKAGDTATNYDPTGHILICLMGNYEIQTPGKSQIISLEELVCWFYKKYNIDENNIGGHLDYAATLCPGKKLYPHVLRIKEELKKKR